MSIVFENKGVIDLKTIQKFGVSIKEKENPIGFFGTGMKYAISILLREGCEVKLQAGLDEFEFQVKEDTIRDQKINSVVMRGEGIEIELPFTTHLGANWEMWQAFRELYCNTVDENGKIYAFGGRLCPEKNVTRFIVKGFAFYEIYKNKGEIILDLPSSKAIDAYYMDIYKKPSSYIYYKGIRIAKLDSPSMFTYNIKLPLELTEDRTVSDTGILKLNIVRSLASLTDKKIIRQLLLADDTYWERSLYWGHLSYTDSASISDEFRDCLAKLYKNNDDRLNYSAKMWFMDYAQKSNSKYFDFIELNEVQKKQWEKTLRICTLLYPDFEDYKAKFVKTLGRQTMAIAIEEEQTMVFSEECFRMGTKFLISTALEEYAHLKTGFKDCSRGLQTWLFDQICTFTETYILKDAM